MADDHEMILPDTSEQESSSAGLFEELSDFEESMSVQYVTRYNKQPDSIKFYSHFQVI